MDRHFILPATIAAAVHAGLLFGIPGSPAPAPTKTPVPIYELKPFPIPPEPPPESTEASVTKGSPDNARPVIPEPPTSAKPTDITVPVPEAVVQTINVNPEKIPTGNPGDIIGTLDGPGWNKNAPLSIVDLDGTPRTRAQASPIYPFEAKSRGITGTVNVEFTVDESGGVLNPRVIESTSTIFNESAMHAVSKWKFEPGKRGGRAVRFKMVVPIVFSLNDDR